MESEFKNLLQEGSLRGFDTRGKVLAEYIWLGTNVSNGTDLHNKTRVLPKRPQSATEVEWWTYDTPEGGEVLLRPRALYLDPLRGGDHVIVLCDCMSPPMIDPVSGQQIDLRPHYTNNRVPCEDVMALAQQSEPCFTIRQEYFMMNRRSGWPLGWSCKGVPAGNTSSIGPIGLASSPGRLLAEAHLRACIHAGLKIADTEDSIPGKWSYTVGPCPGVEAGDHLWLSRYVMMRLAEKYDLQVSFDPKPIPGDWPGAACHVEISTTETRVPQSGWFEIERQLHFLRETHVEHMLAYGVGNVKRFAGAGGSVGQFLGLGASSGFTWGVGDRQASVHVPLTSLVNRCGGYEDRRPGASMDPYLVLMMLVSSALQIALPKGYGEGSNRSSGSALQFIPGRGAGAGMLGSTPPNGFLGGSSHGHSHGPMAYVAAMNGSGHGLNAFQRVNSAGAGAGPGAHPGFHQVRVSPSHSRVEDSIDELLDGEEIEDDGEGDLYSDDGEGPGERYTQEASSREMEAGGSGRASVQQFGLGQGQATNAQVQQAQLQHMQQMQANAGVTRPPNEKSRNLFL